MRRLLYLAPLVALAGIVAAFAVGLRHDPSILPSQLLNQPLPAFALPGIRPGERGFTQATLRGEPALLNVWASWCAACKAEHPVLLRFANEEHVPIYGLAWKDDPAAAARVLAEDGNPYRMTASDPSGRTGIDLGVTGAPETFIVDKHGRVRYKQVGPIGPEVWDGTIAPLLAKLRAEA